jgi:anti-sigma factor RsiW
VRPARCDRSREALSLRLDGALSTFETVLLDRHLRRCGDCRSFAESVAAQTALLRSADLDEPSRRVELPAARGRSLRKAAVGTATALAAVAAAAVFTLTPSGKQAQISANAAAPQLLDHDKVLMVVPAQTSPGSDVTVPRLTMQPASVVDGPVHGLFSTPYRV